MFEEPNNVFSFDIENKKRKRKIKKRRKSKEIECFDCEMCFVNQRLSHGGMRCSSCGDGCCNEHFKKCNIKKCNKCDNAYCQKCQKHHKTNLILCDICGKKKCPEPYKLRIGKYTIGKYTICKCGIKTNIDCAGSCNFGCRFCGKIDCAKCASKCLRCKMFCCSDCTKCSRCKTLCCERCIAYIEKTRECLCLKCLKEYKKEN